MPDNDPSLYPDSHGFTAVRLTYKGGKLFMVMFVPQSAAGLGELERSLPSGGLKPWIDRIANRTVVVHLPKFKLEGDYSLKKPLQALGMRRAFNLPGGRDGAQFDRMTASDDLFISAVIHKTFIEVNEKGTEAAAATGIMMAGAAAPSDPNCAPSFRPFGRTNRSCSRSATPTPTTFSFSAAS